MVTVGNHLKESSFHTHPYEVPPCRVLGRPCQGLPFMQVPVSSEVVCFPSAVGILRAAFIFFFPEQFSIERQCQAAV